MEPQADPLFAAELLLAVTGIFPDGPLVRVTGKLAAALPKQLKEEVEAWLDQKQPKAFKAPKLPDIEALLTDLEPMAGDELILEIEDEDIGSDYLVLLNKARAYMDDQIPRLNQDTPIGQKLLPLGIVERGRVAAVLSVLDDPARMMAEIRMGSLTAAQAEAFRTNYPALFDFLKRTIWRSLLARYKDAAGYALPFEKERVLRVLVGVSAQVSLSKAGPEGSQETGPGLPKVSITFKNRLATKAQNLEDEAD